MAARRSRITRWPVRFIRYDSTALRIASTARAAAFELAQDVIVDRDLHEKRLHELERGDQREEHAGGRDQPVGRPGDPGQATDEPSIEGATEDLVVLDVTHRRSPPRAAGCARAERTRRRL